MAYFGFSVFDIVQSEIELIVMRFRPATVFRAAIGEYTDQSHVLLCQERQDPVVQQISSGNRRLRSVELGCSPLRIGIDEGLL